MATGSILLDQKDTSLAIWIQWLISIGFFIEILYCVLESAQVVEVLICDDKAIIVVELPEFTCRFFNVVKSCIWIDFKRTHIALLINLLKIKLFKIITVVAVSRIFLVDLVGTSSLYLIQRSIQPALPFLPILIFSLFLLDGWLFLVAKN